ncbi:hypothetical protein C8Q70DRAFT_299816 [Cubamyces menziesii]|nr:hypothetical protein C8Q70DRAFT_299816 [Cubamyces menziesii]
MVPKQGCVRLDRTVQGKLRTTTSPRLSAPSSSIVEWWHKGQYCSKSPGQTSSQGRQAPRPAPMTTLNHGEQTCSRCNCRTNHVARVGRTTARKAADPRLPVFLDPGKARLDWLPADPATFDSRSASSPHLLYLGYARGNIMLPFLEKGLQYGSAVSDPIARY